MKYKTVQNRIERRNMLKLVLGSTLAAMASVHMGTLQAEKSAGERLITDILKGRKVENGGIKIETPGIAENGNSVPVLFDVTSPMTESDYIKTVHLIAEANPSPKVATFHFTPLSGKASAFTRIRLAKTSKVTLIAFSSDGSIRKASTEVKVTVGGCG